MMARHPQLRVSETPLFDRSEGSFFETTLAPLLGSRRALARSIGGRYGFVIDEREWVLDLDHGRLRGDTYTSAVQDDDALDAVLYLSSAGFARLVLGEVSEEARFDERRPGALATLTRFLLETLS